MKPRLLEIPLGSFALPINSYGFMLMIGFLVATIVAIRRGKDERIEPEFIMDLSIYMMIFGIVGSRLFYIAEYHEQFNFGFLRFWDGNLDVWAMIAGWMAPLLLRFWRRRGKPLAMPTPREFLKDVGGTVVACAVCGIAIGRGVALVEHRDLYNWDLLKIWEGGIVFYGGLLGAVAFAIYYIRARGISFLKVADLLVPVIMLGFTFGRIGCYLNGCCWGTVVAKVGEAAPWWAIHFPRLEDTQTHRLIGSPAFIDHLHAGLVTVGDQFSCWVHPVQFYSMAGNFGLFLLLSWWWRRRAAIGEVFCAFGITYPVLRFLLEIVRGDNERDYAGLTISQAVSIVAFIVSLVAFYLIRMRTPGITGRYREAGPAAGGEAVAAGSSTPGVAG